MNTSTVWQKTPLNRPCWEEPIDTLTLWTAITANEHDQEPMSHQRAEKKHLSTQLTKPVFKDNHKWWLLHAICSLAALPIYKEEGSGMASLLELFRWNVINTCALALFYTYFMLCGDTLTTAHGLHMQHAQCQVSTDVVHTCILWSCCGHKICIFMFPMISGEKLVWPARPLSPLSRLLFWVLLSNEKERGSGSSWPD